MLQYHMSYSDMVGMEALVGLVELVQMVDLLEMVVLAWSASSAVECLLQELTTDAGGTDHFIMGEKEI